MTTYQAHDKLSVLKETVLMIPDDTVLLSVTATDDIIEIQTYDSDMDFISWLFDASLIRESYNSDYGIEYFMHRNVKVFKLINKTAALSGTEDSGNSLDHQHDTTGNGGCQDGLGRT